MTKMKKELTNSIKRKIKQIEEQQLENKLQRIEDMKNDSVRCFEATKQINTHPSRKYPDSSKIDRPFEQKQFQACDNDFLIQR